MKLQTAVLTALMFMAAAFATAAEPVAVRVDVEPVSFGDDGTRVAVTVQVAPEDRGRIGRNAMVRIELDGAAPPGESPLWAVRMAEDGSGRIDTLWPPGEHTLRLEISDPAGGDRGLWVGTVRIPGVVVGRGAAVQAESPAVTPDAVRDMEDPPSEAATMGAAGAATTTVETSDAMLDGAPEESAEHVGESASDTVGATSLGATAVGLPGVDGAEPEDRRAGGAAPDVADRGPQQAASPREPEAVEAEPTAVATEVAVAEATPAVERVAAPREDETVAESPPQAPAEEPTPTDPASGAAEMVVMEPPRSEGTPPSPVPEDVPEPGDVDAPAVEAQARKAPVPVEQEARAASAQQPLSAASAEAPAPPAAPAPEPVVETDAVVVEPLRPAGAPPAPMSGTEPPPKAQRDAGPPAEELAAAFAAWRAADPAGNELTALVMRGREPARQVTQSDLQLRIGGQDAAINAVGAVDRAPLLLGIAVDAAADAGIGWPGAGGRLAALIERAAAGRGRTFYAAPGVGVGDWDAGPPAAVPSNTSGDVATLIADSLRRFEGTQGRRALLLITDGRSDPDKDTWQRAVDAAAESGAPVLIVALWDEEFGRRARNHLRDVVDASGGSLFLVQGRPQLDRAVERFGPLLDAAVSVRFTVPAGVELPAEVRLESAAPDLEVSAPRRVR